MLALAGCGYLLLVSISATPDTPCGSVVDPNFGWSTSSHCGVVHVGTAVTCGFLVVVGVGLLLARRRTLLIGQLAAVVALGAALAIGWRAATYEEPVVGSGWASLRSLSLIVALASVVAVASMAARHRPGRSNHEPASTVGAS